MVKCLTAIKCNSHHSLNMFVQNHNIKIFDIVFVLEL